MKPFLCCCLFALILPLRASAGEADGWKLIDLHNGPNTPDLDFDGQPDLVAVGHRENYNAHSGERTFLMMHGKTDPALPDEWQIVPTMIDKREGGDPRDSTYLVTYGGANGLLEDFRLMRDEKRRTTVLVVAERDFGESFVDSRRVTFTFCKLTWNKEQLPGSPVVCYRPYKKLRSKKTYVNVTDAFRDELGIEVDKKSADYENSKSD